MDQMNDMLQAFANGLGAFAPRLIGAAMILLVAWLGAYLSRVGIGRLLKVAEIDARFKSPGLSGVLADVAYWMVWLLALPALLGALQLEGLLSPVNAMLSRLLGFLPNLIGAIAAFAIGYLVARIVREVVTGLLTAAGSERFAARMGIDKALGDQTLAGLLGSVVFTLILLPTLAAALHPLGLDAITDPISRLLNTVIGFIPKLVSAIIIMVIAAILGRALASLATAMLAGMGINEWPEQWGLKKDFRLGGRDISEMIGTALMVAALMLAATQACQELGFSVLTEAVSTLGVVLAHLATAVVIMACGLWAAAAAARMVEASAKVNARALANLTRAVLIFFTAALALRQAGLPSEIIAIAFGSIVGSVALGVAIAVGVGGRHVAARLLERAANSFGEKETPSSVKEPTGD